MIEEHFEIWPVDTTPEINSNLSFMFTRRECRNLASRNPPDWQKFTVQFMTIVEENLEFGYVKLVIVKEIHF